MKLINALYVLTSILVIGCASTLRPNQEQTGSGSVRRPAAEVNPPLLSTGDRLRIRIRSLDAQKFTGSQIFISAQLHICVHTTERRERCMPAGSTNGLGIRAGEIKNYQHEDARSMPDSYSPVVTEVEIRQSIAALNANLTDRPYLRIDLRREKPEPVAFLSSRTAPFPPSELLPTNEARILRNPVQIEVVDANGTLAGTVEVLIHRPGVRELK